jgi:hypothetical protein
VSRRWRRRSRGGAPSSPATTTKFDSGGEGADPPPAATEASVWRRPTSISVPRHLPPLPPPGESWATHRSQGHMPHPAPRWLLQLRAPRSGGAGWRWGAPARREPATPAPPPRGSGGGRGGAGWGAPRRRPPRAPVAAATCGHGRRAVTGTGELRRRRARFPPSPRGNQLPPGCGRRLHIVAGDGFLLQCLFLLSHFFTRDAFAECYWRLSQPLKRIAWQTQRTDGGLLVRSLVSIHVRRHGQRVT